MIRICRICFNGKGHPWLMICGYLWETHAQLTWIYGSFVLLCITPQWQLTTCNNHELKLRGEASRYSSGTLFGLSARGVSPSMKKHRHKTPQWNCIQFSPMLGILQGYQLRMDFYKWHDLGPGWTSQPGGFLVHSICWRAFRHYQCWYMKLGPLTSYRVTRFPVVSSESPNKTSSQKVVYAQRTFTNCQDAK